MESIIRIALSVWVGAIAYRDWRTGIVPNELVLPVLVWIWLWRLAMACRYPCLCHWPILLGASAVVLAFFNFRFLGGGSAKFLLALVALFPTLDFLGLLVAVAVLGAVALSVEDWRGRMAFVVNCLRERRFPTDSELNEHGERVEWLYALAALIYLWEVW